MKTIKNIENVQGGNPLALFMDLINAVDPETGVSFKETLNSLSPECTTPEFMYSVFITCMKEADA